MRDAQYNAVRDFCRPIAERWIKLTGAAWDKIELQWSDHYFDERHDEGHGRSTVAFCKAQWAYLQASITFSCAKLWEYFDEATMLPKDPALIQEWIIHEICHVLVNEMREYDGNRHAETVGHEERVVTRLSRGFMYTHDTAHSEGLGKGLIEGAANATKALKELYPIVHERDGDMYFFLVGDNLQDGIAGFGETPALAAKDFHHRVMDTVGNEWSQIRLRNLVDVVWQAACQDYSVPSTDHADSMIDAVRNGAKGQCPPSVLKRAKKGKR